VALLLPTLSIGGNRLLLLTPEQKQQVLNKLDQFWPKPRICPICKNETWLMQQRVYSQPLFGGVSAVPMPNPESTGFQEEVLPILLFHCGTCGYISTFQASTLGIHIDNVTVEIPKPAARSETWPPAPKQPKS